MSILIAKLSINYFRFHICLELKGITSIMKVKFVNPVN